MSFSGVDVEAQAASQAYHVDGAAGLSSIDKMERSIRHGFIRKVFALLTVQILLMMGIVCIFMYVPSATAYASSASSTWLFVLSGLLFVFLLMALTCIPELNKRYPINLVGLFTVSLLAGVFVGTLVAGINPDYVWVAFASSIGLFLILGLFACQTRLDFSGAGPYLAVGMMLLLVFSLFGGLSSSIHDDWNNGVHSIIWIAIAMALFSMYVVYDMQLVIGGKHRHQLGVDDYIVATLSLFTDFLMIFACMLGASQA